jgi:hypothetical protein
MGSWLTPEREVTFKGSGRTAVVRDAPNFYALFGDPELAPHLEAWLDGSLDDATVALRIAEEIVRAMMVRPRIAGIGERLPQQDPDDPDVVPYEALHGSEVDELADMWKESVQRAARFRGESNGAGNSQDGVEVGGAAEPARRARTRKPRSVAAGS